MLFHLVENSVFLLRKSGSSKFPQESQTVYEVRHMGT